MADKRELIPEITNEDIDWVIELMNLDDIDEPRRAFLTSRSTLDVSACPGSGKTTLIVAKLAILARKWPHQTKGICVLSHTNVAREEIQHRLGRTVVGHRLLGYPHFIDTIHGFVNRFLALPWLNSNGYPSATIDNDVTTAYRRGVLSPKEYYGLQSFLTSKHRRFDALRICDRALNFEVGGSAFPARSETDSFQSAKKAVEAAAKAGYFCYDEMFIWARALLEDFPNSTSLLAKRFPLVIIDEMQDTAGNQGVILHEIFPRNSPDLVVQRVGDPNQAIFDGLDSQPDQHDPFPDSDATKNLNIPNSYRFGEKIATLASPFSVTPVGTDGLCGIGPKVNAGNLEECPHAIFIFPDDNAEGVLDAYGRHVLSIFDDAALEKGTITAVGSVHQNTPDVMPGHAHYPKSVPHYWGGYLADNSRFDRNPHFFVQYVVAAQAVSKNSGELSDGIEKITSGLIRLASKVGNAGHLKRKVRKHRAVADALKEDIELLAIYQKLINAFLIEGTQLTEDIWKGLREDILRTACALCDGEVDKTKLGNFLDWSDDNTSLILDLEATPAAPGPNIYRVEDGGRYVDIQLGSIHSVKGQTHLSTMVLSTYWYAHSSIQMLPWLLGDKSNGNGAGSRDIKRLLQTYVAMTRPSHLVCLTLPISTLGTGDVYEGNIQTLMDSGWSVIELK